MKSYRNCHARLAAAGINILNLIPINSEYSAIIFEYSWHDPKNPNKLHWSKSILSIDKSPGTIDEELLARVQSARQELESGE